jgi:hypothetical protein
MTTPLDFIVRDVDATIPGGLPVEIQGRRFDSGPVQITLDDAHPPGASGGTLDYDANVARARFLVRLEFPALREALRSAGLEEALEPVRGEITSSGDILPDHSFALRGSCRLASQDLFRDGSLDAEVLAGT